MEQQQSLRFKSSDWALILGASSGFGGATAVELARHGMNICGVHFDRAATMPAVEEVKQKISAAGVKMLFFNVNAADADKRTEERLCASVDALPRIWYPASLYLGEPREHDYAATG